MVFAHLVLAELVPDNVQPICFLALWGTLKLLRKGQWHLVDLSNGQDVADKMLELHEIRFRSAEEVGRSGRSIQNLWGLL